VCGARGNYGKAQRERGGGDLGRFCIISILRHFLSKAVSDLFAGGGIDSSLAGYPPVPVSSLACPCPASEPSSRLFNV